MISTCRPSIKIKVSEIERVIYNFHEQPEANFSDWLINELYYTSSLNTQSCTKGLLVVRDFCFWAVWAARPVLKKRSGLTISNFWGRFFHVFRGKNNVNFFKDFVASAPKRCIKWSFKKWKKNLKKPDKTPITSRHVVLFCKIQVRPQSCWSYPLWCPWVLYQYIHQKKCLCIVSIPHCYNTL